MRMRKILAFVSIAALLAIAGAMSRISADAGAAAGTAEVKIDNFTFTPATLTVKAGTPIIWTNRDDIPHTVVSEDKEFKSRALDTDEKFTFTPTKPGTYSYFCSIHPHMTGKVVVE
jgi:plastocyanin